MRAFLLHLRLHFQLILSGIFLWGYLLAGGVPNARGLFGFILFHVLLYGGATTVNAYYDQDDGPITGLRRPPPAGPVCLWGGVAFMAIGAVLAWKLGATFALLYSAMALLGLGYSHPRVRFKNGPLASVGIVALGQGGLGFLGGAAAAVPRGLPAPGAAWILGGVAATLFTTALYPLTQVFQIDADLARGDRTFAVHFGPRIVFRTSITCFVLGAAAALPALRALFPAGVAAAFLLFLALCIAFLARWARRYDPQSVRANHDRVFGFGLATSGGFLLLIAWRLIDRWRP